MLLDLFEIKHTLAANLGAIVYLNVFDLEDWQFFKTGILFVDFCDQYVALFFHLLFLYSLLLFLFLLLESLLNIF